MTIAMTPDPSDLFAICFLSIIARFGYCYWNGIPDWTALWIGNSIFTFSFHKLQLFSSRIRRTDNWPLAAPPWAGLRNVFRKSYFKSVRKSRCVEKTNICISWIIGFIDSSIPSGSIWLTWWILLALRYLLYTFVKQLEIPPHINCLTFCLWSPHDSDQLQSLSIV